MDILEYYFGYCCSTPFWANGECLPYEELNIDKYLKQEIKELQKIYQSTYNEDDPRESIFVNDYQHAIFVDRVLCSARLLTIALSKEYEVIFDKEHWEDWRSRINTNLEKF